MTLPAFAEFYAAVHGREPFPWQVALAEEVLARGWGGLQLDLPTGAGKTSAFDVALYCLASAPDRMPRRTMLVVDRRIVVDQAADHARRLRHALESAQAGPARAVADALRTLWRAGAGEPCFAIGVLRGGMPRDNDWARRPDQPVLGVSTVDQVGSRLLFRGYGIHPRSAPIHAGLVGNDTLILLDEVHLAVPFAQTLHAIATRFRPRARSLPDRYAVVTMSATAAPGTRSERVLRLGDADRRHPVLSQRLNARKYATLVSMKVSGSDESAKRDAVAKRLVAEALDLRAVGAKTIGIVVNRVDTARRALARLHEAGVAVEEALLVTGRMRPIDRDRIVERTLLPRAGAGRDRAHVRPLIVVATQCIEAGADLDFDALVTECASLDALRQRFGRVDRRGELGETRSVIVARSDLSDGDPVYGPALSRTWEWLQEIAVDDRVDFGIANLPAGSDELVATADDAPVLLPAHLDGWAQTSISITPDPDVSHWLHGPARADADVQIVWRSIDLDDPALIDVLMAVRPSTLEAISVPIAAARRWLAGEDVPEIADVIGSATDDDRGRVVEDAIVALRWRGDDSELVHASAIRPGDVVIVPISRGGVRHGSFDPDSREPVVDVGDLAQLRARGRPALRLHRDALVGWGLEDGVIERLPERDDDEPLSEYTDKARAWVAEWPGERPVDCLANDAEWRATRTALTSRRSRVVVAGDTCVLVGPAVDGLATAEIGELVTEDDESSFRAAEVTLRQHSDDVRLLVGQYARSLGFGDTVVEDLMLAAWLHDTGKADPRFQRWLAGGDEVRMAMAADVLAKSSLAPGNAAQRRRARERAGYPAGYRHELLSLAMVRENELLLRRAHDRDLVLHLVASHHGWCRPFAPPIDHPEDLRVELVHGDDRLVATTRHQLARLDSGVVDRFWSLTERYGWWGLAWLETLVRLADHRASELATEGP